MGKTSILLTYLCVRNTKCHEWRTGSSEYYIIYNKVINWPLLRVSLIPQISPTPHPGIEKLLPHLTEVREVEEKEGPVFPLQELLPADLSEVFRYSGSLTTPGCNEIVQVRPQWDLRAEYFPAHLSLLHLSVDRPQGTAGHHWATDGEI